MLKIQVFFLVVLVAGCKASEDCPDKNAERQACAVEKCMSTCQKPDQNDCDEVCVENGCRCKPGFILSEKGGKCIPVDQCPGGDPCGANATFAYCAAGCPTNYCPHDDSRAIIACSMPYPCRSGCVCKLNHLRKSNEDPRCVVSSDCSPVKCTRPNEEWNSCATGCLREDCEFANKEIGQCNELLLNCQPKCVCSKGYYRNNQGECVPANQC